MAYKKPKIIAKSEPKQTYVAGCPETNSPYMTCGTVYNPCLIMTPR